MSVGIGEVIQAGGYDLKTIDDARWLLGQQDEWEELIEQAEELVEEYDEEEWEEKWGELYDKD